MKKNIHLLILAFIAFTAFQSQIKAQCPVQASLLADPDMVLDLDGPDDATISECGEVDIFNRAFVQWSTTVSTDDYPEEVEYTDAHSGGAPDLGF